MWVASPPAPVTWCIPIITGEKCLCEISSLLGLPRPAPSPPGSTHFTYLIIYIRYSVNVTCKQWLCSSVLDIYCTSVCPGRASSSVALPEVSFIILLFALLKVFFRQHVKFFLTLMEGLRAERVVHCTDGKAIYGNVTVIWGYKNKKAYIAVLLFLTDITEHTHLKTEWRSKHYLIPEV